MIRTIPPVDQEALEQGLRRLKLRHMQEHLEDINELALQEEPSYMDFLGYLIAREVEGRDRTQKETRLKSARFPFYRTLNDFDFGFQNSVSRQTLLAGFLQAHPNLSGVFCTDALGGVGAATSVREADKVGRVTIVSFGTDQGTLDLIKEGVIDASIAQGTWNMGYWPMLMLYSVRHDLVEPVEGWQTKGINPLPGVVDTGTNVVTKENVDAFYVK